jgi:glycerate 2-kinase
VLPNGRRFITSVINDVKTRVSPFSVLAAMDKFRGTATASELCDDVARAAIANECSVDLQPMSDGGEGFRGAFRGNEVLIDVPGPLGAFVHAPLTLVSESGGLLAVFEVADVVGRQLLVSPSSKQALAASSAGVGQLIVAAVELGARSILVGCGGSATSDGGLGCYEVLRDAGGLSVPLTAATDVTAHFSGARRYAEQKGVAASDLKRVDERLSDIRTLYLAEQGIDVESLERTGASGGIPGALAALGASLASGFESVVNAVALEQRLESASLVVTGEGRLDHGSLEGKVTVGIAELVNERVPLLVVCGSVDDEAADVFRRRFPTATVVSLVERFGETKAMRDVRSCVSAVVNDEIALRSNERFESD